MITHLQPHAVVADVNELVDSLDALLVSGEGQLLPLALLVRVEARGGVRAGPGARFGGWGRGRA